MEGRQGRTRTDPLATGLDGDETCNKAEDPGARNGECICFVDYTDVAARPLSFAADGAAFGAVLRVDPVNQVVVTLVRTREGADYKPNLYSFLVAVDDGIVDRRP